MLTLADLHHDVQKQANPEKARLLSRFFKTGKGEYGEGDVFLGLTVPQSRAIAVTYQDLPLTDVKKLLTSKFHEERLIALLLLVHNFKWGDSIKRKEIYEFYLAHTHYINNWDLVDLSAGYIVGGYLWNCRGSTHQNKMIGGVESLNVLKKLAQSENVWERRIAIMATFQFIMYGSYSYTFAIADILLHDPHDLIHKAVGWMLREVGKRCSQEAEEEFLKERYKTMPRTMLRYAIERFPEEKRRAYLRGLV